MEWEEIEAQLTSLADRLDIEVRHIRYQGEGGLCILRGKRVLIVNDWLAAPDRVSVMAKALATLDGLDEMYLLPEIRELLEKYAAEEQD